MTADLLLISTECNGVTRTNFGGVSSFFVWDRGAGGAKRPRAWPKAVLGEGAGRGSSPPAMGVRGYNPRKLY